MLDPALEQYLTQTIDSKDSLTMELEAYAKENHVPIMEPLGMEFVQQMIRLKEPVRILEIGTAIGYSAIQMAYSNPDVHITTIERDEDRYNEARRNIARAQLEKRITIIQGDALEVSDTVKVHGPFDMLFIDAAKGQYQRFFETYKPMLEDNGFILSDNVLFKGYVAKHSADGSNTAKIASKIRSYNDWLLAHPQFKTTIMPIGDGIALSVKR